MHVNNPYANIGFLVMYTGISCENTDVDWKASTCVLLSSKIKIVRNNGVSHK